MAIPSILLKMNAMVSLGRLLATKFYYQMVLVGG
jgi:hypothetical protein